MLEQCGCLSVRRCRCAHFVIFLAFLMIFILLLQYILPYQESQTPDISSIRHESRKYFNGKANGVPRIMNYTNSQLPKNYPWTWFRTKTSMGTIPIYVHGSHDLISQYLMSPIRHTWEPERLSVLREKLDADSDTHLVDIGCNLGVFTLTAAAMGRKVVAVDANLENLKKLRKSVLRNGFEDRVTLIYNAVAEEHAHVALIINPTNIGGSGALKTSENSKDTEVSVAVPTILLDDLLKVINFKKAVIKMDIENYEYQALRGAHYMFKKIDIRALFMEWWQVMREPSRAEWIIKFMKENSFVPSEDTEGKISLVGKKYKNWPGDLNWIKVNNNTFPPTKQPHKR